MKKGLLIAGLIILLIGILGGIILTVVGFSSTIGSDPASDYHHKVTLSGQSIHLTSGDYDIWYDGWSISDVELTDHTGHRITIDEISGTQSINSRSKYGTFDISTSGQYTLTYSGSATVYITDPISVGGGIGMVFGGICGGIFVTILGGILTLVGAIGKSKQKYSGSKQEYVPPNQKKCPKCGKMVSETETICPDCYSNL